MKSFKYLFFAVTLMALFTSPEVSAKKRLIKKVHMFGFSASFRDSVIYFTNVQAVDNVWMDTKGNILLGRNSYASQLKNYMTNSLGMPHRTCIVMFAEKRKDADKKLLKLKRKYTEKAKDKYDIRYLTDTDFSFQSLNLDESDFEEAVEEKQPKNRKGKNKSKK